MTADLSCTQNGLDTRVGQVISGNTTSWKRSGAYVTDSVLNEGSTAFTPGVSSRNGSTSTFTHAGLKNTDRQSTTTALSATRQYDAFGNLIGSTGTWTTRFGYAGNFGYQGDDNTGLKLLGHRYYDSSTGRFLTRDPIKDGRNWYGYCGNNPVRMVDSNGLDPHWASAKGGVKNSLPKGSGYTVIAMGDVSGKTGPQFEEVAEGTFIGGGPFGGFFNYGGFDVDYVFVFDKDGVLVGVWRIHGGINAEVSLVDGRVVVTVAGEHSASLGRRALGLPLIELITSSTTTGKGDYTYSGLTELIQPWKP